MDYINVRPYDVLTRVQISAADNAELCECVSELGMDEADSRLMG